MGPPEAHEVGERLFRLFERWKYRAWAEARDRNQDDGGD
jgi:acyl-CoA-binding protein